MICFFIHATNAVLIFYPTSIIKKYNPGFIDRLFCEDWSFVMSYLSKVKTVYWLNAALYYCRMNNTSLSNTMSDWYLGVFEAVGERKKPLETANLWCFHEQLQNLLGLRYILNFYYSKVYIMFPSE
ncbi:hypothetical protein [Brevinema andersonii]|nr:hypothetical protein [Brevinema andersonii]